MSKQLSLLSCGGAITSESGSDGSHPSSALPMAALVQEMWEMPVTHTAVSAVHSATATPESWTQLLREVRKSRGPVLVTHGTDTIGWSAGALAVTDVAEQRPVVLTGANIPFGELNSDAANNLTAALTVCRQMEKGVWVVFAGTPEGPAVVVEGGFARKTLPGDGSITDVSGLPFATVAAGGLVSRRQPRSVDPGARSAGTDFSGEVATFRCWPGLVLPAEAPADRVVIEFYSLSTAPQRVIDGVARWTEGGTKVVAVPVSPVAPQRPATEVPPSAGMVATGAELRPELTFELAVCSQMLR